MWILLCTMLMACTRSAALDGRCSVNPERRTRHVLMYVECGRALQSSWNYLMGARTTTHADALAAACASAVALCKLWVVCACNLSCEDCTGWQGASDHYVHFLLPAAHDVCTPSLHANVPGGKTMGPATSARFCFPQRSSTSVSAKGKVVPGPRLVTSFPETTTGSSE